MKDVKLRWQDAFKERKFVVSFFVSLIMFAGLMLFLSDLCYLQVGGSEIIAPLADAMCFVNCDETNPQVTELG